MSVIISLIIIIISIIIILAIVIKKLPALAIIDINSDNKVKEVKFKDQIIKDRLERDLKKIGGLFARAWLKFYKKTSKIFDSFHEQLKKKQQNYRINTPMSLEEKKEKIQKLFSSVEDLWSKESFNRIENQLIEIIGLEKTNILAFFKLGNLYHKLKKYIEARQSYHHVLRLMQHDDIETDLNLSEVYFSLALLEKEEEKYDIALEYIIQALEVEPNNPRYLDLILDLSIMKKDKKLAIYYFNKLVKVNPENNKLEELQRRIEEL